MRVVVKLFAGARELAGQQEIEIELAPAATIGELRAALLADCPDLRPLMPYALFAIDANYATDETAVPHDAEIACIPPVSGG